MEAYFQALEGVERVEQGWISAAAPDDAFSEAVIVHYNPLIISLDVLINIHLRTHSSTRQHSLRQKYRSAIYVFDESLSACERLIAACQWQYDDKIITVALAFRQFKPNTEKYRNYYQRNKEGLFCERYIHPKLKMMAVEFAIHYKPA